MRGVNAHDQQIAADIAALDALAVKLSKPPPAPKSCRHCKHFEPWPLNPTAAVGKCGAGLGYFYPNNVCDRPENYAE